MGRSKVPTRDEIVAELEAIRDRLAEVPNLYDRRLHLFQQARQLNPPILQRELAAAAGVTETAVTKELRRAEAKAAAS